jgi:hypothetical protein
VRCAQCDKGLYNAPKKETGRETRSVSKREGIKPKLAVRIRRAWGWRCALCGMPPGEHIGHALSVADAAKIGVNEAEATFAENLLPLCAECNLGMGSDSLTPGEYRVIRWMFRIRGLGTNDATPDPDELAEQAANDTDRDGDADGDE